MAQKEAVRSVTETEQWQDVYMRHNFEDTGAYPTSGSLSASPDIIPAGASPYSDPGQLIDDGNWDHDYGGATNADVPNYIYVRGKNLGADDTTAKVYLYASPASLLLYPTDPFDPKKGWKNNPLRTDSGKEYLELEIPGGTRFVTPEAFDWVPQPIAGDHYCLIGRVVTPEHPNEIPAVGDLNDFAKYISEHPNMAWRNVTTMSQSAPTWTKDVEYQQGKKGGKVLLYLKCVNAPEGSAVQFSSGTPGTDPVIYIDKTPVKNHLGPGGESEFIAPLNVLIPEKWHSSIKFVWYSEGKTPLPNMKISLEALMPVGGDSSWDPELERYARPLEEFGFTDELRAATFKDGIGPTSAIALGSYTMTGEQAADRPVDSDVAGKRTSVYLSGFSWHEQIGSLLGNVETAGGVGIERRIDKTGGETDVLSLGADTTTVEADLTVDMELAKGVQAGTTFVTLTTTNVPLGCEVWFKNTAGKVKIAVPPTPVTKEPEFTVMATAALPEGYAGALRGFLDRKGKTLPEDWSVELRVIHAELSKKELEQALAAAGPTPGTVLGSVVVQA